MNPRIKIFNDIREDISDYLFHFTKGEDALLILDKIINEGAIKDINNNGYICFTETPIYMLENYFKFVAKQYKVPKILAPYGIGLKRDWLFNQGARPVIYGLPNEKKDLPENLRWRFVSVSPPNRDWLWLREWRINTVAVEFKPDDIIIVTNNEDEQALFWEVVVDNPFGEPLDDSMVDFKPQYRSIAIEQLPKFNSKNKLEDLLTQQKNDIEDEE